MPSFKHAPGKIQISMFLLKCPKGRFLKRKKANIPDSQSLEFFCEM